MSGKHSSAVIIARVLGTEGYSDHVHNQVERYWKKKVQRTGSDPTIASIEKRFSKLLAELELTERERKIIGRFISLRAEMSFDSGLRIGMQCFAHKNDHEVTPRANNDQLECTCGYGPADSDCRVHGSFGRKR